MLARYESVCYELLRPDEIKALREATPIAYAPAGSLEWHSFQNPLGTDALKAHAVCCEAALKFGGIVLPPYYQGLVGDRNWGPDGWEGYTLGYNQNETFEATYLAITRGLVAAGWKVIVGVTGHDVEPQRAAMERGINAGTEGAAATGFAVLEGTLHEPDDDLKYGMDHAGAWETSCMMHAYPHRTNLDDLRPRMDEEVEKTRMSDPQGIGGWNPLKYASADLGKKIIERMGDLIGQKARDTLTSLE